MKAHEVRTGMVSALPSVRRVGRPKKWQSVEELEELIEAYFRSCFIALTREEKYWVDDGTNDEGDPIGHYNYRTVPAKDADGNQLYELVKQPSVTGLAVALDTNRETLLNYETDPSNAAFFDTIKRAKAIIHEHAEQYLYSGKNQTAGIFSLKNNFKWVDRIETDVTSGGKEVSSLVVQAKVDDILRPPVPPPTDSPIPLPTQE